MKGLYTAIITPFSDDGSIDYDAAEKLLTRQIEAGVSGLIVGGTTGEAATLSAEEKTEFYSFVRDKAGSLDLVAGTGSNNTEESVRLTEKILKTGYRKILAVTPYYNKPSCAGLYNHYKALAETGAKVVLYNVPGRTSLNVDPECLARLAEIKGITAVKEASGDISQLVDYFDKAGMNRFDILSGDDFTATAFIAAGGKGLISVFSNIMPKYGVEMINSALDGNVKKAADMQVKLNKFCHTMFLETNPLPVKTSLSMMGFCSEKFRPPLACMEENNKDILRSVLADYNLINN